MNNYVGKDIGRYHILDQLGEGGMATVYKAYDTRLERNVAIKIIRVDQFAPSVLERILKRFEREAKALARLSHPNIIKVHDYGEYEGTPYLVMEYLPGGTLKQKLGKSMPWQEAIQLLIPVARALDYAHRQGMIHRDVKPSNILITGDGEPMLTDFGIAKILESEESQTLTGTGVGVGTPEYMAPEQWLGKAGVQSDIYSLGVVLYEMVTGRKPYVADTPAAVLLKQANDPLPRPEQFVSSLPEKVERVLFKALAKKPEDRYQNMAEFAATLEGLAAGAAPRGEAELPGTTVNEKGGEFQTETVDEFSLSPKVEGLEATKKVEDNTCSDAALNKEHGEFQTWNVPVEGGGSLREAESTGTTVARELEQKIAEMVTNRKADDASEAQTTDGLFIAEKEVEEKHTTRHLQWLWLGVGVLAVGIVILIFLSQNGAGMAAVSTLTITPTIVPTTEPTLGIGSTQISPIDGMMEDYVPAGPFLMGSSDSDSEAETDEMPQHTVTLDTFWIDQTLVTNGMYAKCVEAGKCSEPLSIMSQTHSDYYVNSEYVDYPVINVDWSQASAYCSWAGRRLPTEAEWEKAARGTDGRIYPWGDQAPNSTLLNFDVNADDTTKVGSYPAGASPYGALDMAGNVWQWVADWYDPSYYSASPSNNPQGPANGSVHVLRGGTLGHVVYDLRSAFRLGFYLGQLSIISGFRCASAQP